MLMRKAIVVALVLGLSGAAEAQTAAPTTAQAAQAVSAEWQGMALEFTHMQERLTELLAAASGAQKALDDTRAYWKAWCGDRPGCAIPLK